MKLEVNKEMLALTKKHIVLDRKIKMKKAYIKNANCYTYALNIDLPMYINIGDLSNKYKEDVHFKEFENLFTYDCKALGLEIEKVSKDYLLSNENEWLVALFGTDYYTDLDFNHMCDFHFIKKNYNTKWSAKYFDEKPRYKDDSGRSFVDVEKAVFGTYDYNKNVIKYNYIGTYKLTYSNKLD